MINELNKNLKNSKITLDDKIIKIELINEGWITEFFLILNILKKNKSCDIKAIFQVYKEDKMIVKELLEENLINVNYVNFIKIIKNETKNKNIGSGKISWNKINEIEIRLNKKLKEITDNGVDINYTNLILKEIIELELS